MFLSCTICIRRHVIYLRLLSLSLSPSLSLSVSVSLSFCLLQSKITSRRALSYARESSIRVCLPAIPIKGSIVLAIREFQRPRARSCAFPRNWTGSILRRHPCVSLSLFLRLLHWALYVHIYTHTHTHTHTPSSLDHPSGSKDPFPFGQQTLCLKNVLGSKMDILLSFGIYCSSL